MYLILNFLGMHNINTAYITAVILITSEFFYHFCLWVWLASSMRKAQKIYHLAHEHIGPLNLGLHIVKWHRFPTLLCL